MCLEIWLEVDASQRGQLEIAARKASGSVIAIAVQHPSPWPWASQRPVRAFVSSGHSCACSLLSDDADWDAQACTMWPEILEPLAQAINAILIEGLKDVSLQALWGGDHPIETKHVSAKDLVALARSSQLGTKTRYVVDRAG